MSVPLTSWRRAAAILCTALLTVVLCASAVRATTTPIDAMALTAPLVLHQGKAEIVSMPSAVSDILVADPGIVDVTAVQPDRLYIVGVAQGNTNIIALDAQGNTLTRLDVTVTFDIKALQATLTELFPDEDVQVSTLQNSVILKGEVSTPEVANKVENVVAYYLSNVFDEDFDHLGSHANILLTVRGDQQVMLKVRLVEASRSILRELSTQTFANGITTNEETGSFALAPPGLQSGTLPAGADVGALAFQNTGGDALIAGASEFLENSALLESTLWLNTGTDILGYLGLTLQALETEGLINILAEPTLSAISGEEASFLAGGEFPVPTGRDRDGNITIEFKEFGASLAFRPVVLSPDRISLNMETEVSALDNNNAYVNQGLTIPGLTVRRASTTVEMPSGGTLMIAGILQSQMTKSMAGLPGIKDTPILGDLMSSDSFQRNDTELIVMVTPYLVEPFGDKEVDVEKEREAPKPKPLKEAMTANMRRVYGAAALEDIEGGQGHGYILD